MMPQPGSQERHGLPPNGRPLSIVDELPLWAVAIPGISAIAFMVMGLSISVFIATMGGEAIIVGLVAFLICLIAAALGGSWNFLSRRAEITVDDGGLVLRYPLLRFAVRAERGRIAAVRVYHLPPVPPFGSAFWVLVSGRLAVLPFRPGVWRPGTRESRFLPWVRLCGVGTQSIVVITLASGRWPLGVLTNHAEEVAAALAALFPPRAQPVASVPPPLPPLGQSPA